MGFISDYIFYSLSVALYPSLSTIAAIYILSLYNITGQCRAIVLHQMVVATILQSTQQR